MAPCRVEWRSDARHPHRARLPALRRDRPLARGRQRARLSDRASEIQNELDVHGPDALRFLLSDQGPVGRPQAGGPGAGTTTIVIQPTGRAFGLVPRELVNDLPVASGFDAAKAGQVDIRTVALAGTPFRVRSEPIAIGADMDPPGARQSGGRAAHARHRGAGPRHRRGRGPRRRLCFRLLLRRARPASRSATPCGDKRSSQPTPRKAANADLRHPEQRRLPAAAAGAADPASPPRSRTSVRRANA